VSSKRYFRYVQHLKRIIHVVYGHNGREYETDKINRNNLYSKEDEEEEEHVKVNTIV
jgi:hypothetical protein